MSIYIDTASITMNQVSFTNVAFNSSTQYAGGISCFNCRGIKILNSTFMNISGTLGGAFYIQES